MLSVSFEPLFPWWALGMLGLAAGVMLGYGLVRRARGSGARAVAMGTLLLVMANPILSEEERRAEPDIAVAVVDESASQTVPGRAEAAEQALAHLQDRLARRGDIELKVVRAGDADSATGQGDEDADGTRLFSVLDRALAGIPRQRRAGAIMITDGQVHDIPARFSGPSDKRDETQPTDTTSAGARVGARVGASAEPPALPIHVLLTGAPDERDRRIAIVNAPKFGIVGKEVALDIRIEDSQAAGQPIALEVSVDGTAQARQPLTIGEIGHLTVPLDHAGTNIIELSVPPAPGEITQANNRAVVTINGVRERLRVLLVSGEPHPGERVWRNLLKADPSVDLVHFTILRPPEKQDSTPVQELSLIAFPIRELFEVKLTEFDLIIFDRYRRRGVLPSLYLRNIADYVQGGGAVLEAAGPAYATPLGLHRTALGALLPGAPTGEIVQRGLLPQLSETGRRHPITSDLPGARRDLPGWGRWFRQIEARPERGHVLLDGAEGHPLLIVDRVGKGRVAQLLSDHIWLWARGFEGGGPHSQLLRRLAHWLMKEPELEEDSLSAHEKAGQLVITRRSVTGAFAPVTVTTPSGETQTLPLSAGDDGRAIATTPARAPGIYRVSDGTLSTLAAVGALNPKEFADMRATDARLSGIAEASGGRIGWIRDGLPDVRRVRPERTTAGRGWIGLIANRDYVVTGIRVAPLFPAFTLLALALGALALAWRREGR